MRLFNCQESFIELEIIELLINLTSTIRKDTGTASYLFSCSNFDHIPADILFSLDSIAVYDLRMKKAWFNSCSSFRN